MKAKDLIKILETDPERIVVLSKDGEGNWYDTLYTVNEMKYDKKNHEVRMEKLTQKDKDDGYSEEDVMSGGEKAFVLYP